MLYFLQLLASALGAVGFALLMQVRRRYIPLIAALSFAAWGVSLLLDQVLDSFFTMLLAAAFCCLMSEISARILRCPVTVLLMPSAVSLIPGSDLFYTMYHAFSGEYGLFRGYGLKTLRSVIAIAAGFAIINLIFRARKSQTADKQG